MPRVRQDWLVAAAVAGLTVAVFLPALRCGFVSYDDPDYVVGNPHVAGGLSGPDALWAFSTFQVANWHPLTWLSLQLDATLWKDADGDPAPWGFHLTNVLLHAASAAALYLALHALTGALWRSAAVAVLFAVHPLRVESVVWIAERKDVLSTFFGMLTLGAYASYARAPSVRRYLVVASGLALSLLAKPMLVTLPFLLLVLDWWPLRRWQPDGEPGSAVTPAKGLRPAGSVRQLLLEKLPLLVLVSASCVVTYLAQAQSGATRDLAAVPLVVRLENAAVSYVDYLAMTAWPVNLAPFYPHPGATLPAVQVAGSAVLLAGVTAAALVLRRRAPYLLTGWLWYLGTLVPVIGLVQVGGQALADRYTYFPQVGILLAASWGAAALGSRWPRLVLAAGAAAALALAVGTANQIQYWQTSTRLWEHARQVTRPSPTLLISLGTDAEGRARPDEAERFYREALALDPDSLLAHTDLGMLLARQGKERWDEAAEHLEAACRLAPDYAIARTNYGKILFQQGKLDAAAREHRAAIERLPEFAEAHYNLGRVELERHDRDRATECFRAAVRLQPNYPDANYWLATILFETGPLDECVARLQAALRGNPKFAEAHLFLGQALDRQKESDEAGRHYAEAVRLNPGLAAAWYGLGMAQARQGRPADAEGCLSRAVEIDPGPPAYRLALAVVLDGLAGAQARAGQFSGAVETERRARDLAAGANREDVVRRIEENLRRYERGDKGPPP